MTSLPNRSTATATQDELDALAEKAWLVLKNVKEATLAVRSASLLFPSAAAKVADSERKRKNGGADATVPHVPRDVLLDVLAATVSVELNTEWLKRVANGEVSVSRASLERRVYADLGLHVVRWVRSNTKEHRDLRRAAAELVGAVAEGRASVGRQVGRLVDQLKRPRAQIHGRLNLGAVVLSVFCDQPQLLYAFLESCGHADADLRMFDHNATVKASDGFWTSYEERRGKALVRARAEDPKAEASFVVEKVLNTFAYGANPPHGAACAPPDRSDAARASEAGLLHKLFCSASRGAALERIDAALNGDSIAFERVFDQDLREARNFLINVRTRYRLKTDPEAVLHSDGSRLEGLVERADFAARGGQFMIDPKLLARAADDDPDDDTPLDDASAVAAIRNRLRRIDDAADGAMAREDVSLRLLRIDRPNEVVAAGRSDVRLAADVHAVEILVSGLGEPETALAVVPLELVPADGTPMILRFGGDREWTVRLSRSRRTLRVEVDGLPSSTPSTAVERPRPSPRLVLALAAFAAFALVWLAGVSVWRALRGPSRTEQPVVEGPSGTSLPAPDPSSKIEVAPPHDAPPPAVEKPEGPTIASGERGVGRNEPILSRSDLARAAWLADFAVSSDPGESRSVESASPGSAILEPLSPKNLVVSSDRPTLRWRAEGLGPGGVTVTIFQRGGAKPFATSFTVPDGAAEAVCPVALPRGKGLWWRLEGKRATGEPVESTAAARFGVVDSEVERRLARARVAGADPRAVGRDYERVGMLDEAEAAYVDAVHRRLPGAAELLETLRRAKEDRR